MKNLPAAARVYILAFCGIGVASLASQLPDFRPRDWTQFTIYLAIAVICSGLKVAVPGIKGTMSVTYVIFLIGIVHLSLPETLVMGVLATLVQTYWHAKKAPQPVQALFNLCSITVSIYAAHVVYHLPALNRGGQAVATLLWIAALVYFFLNTFSVTLVVGLTERRPLTRIWRECYFWSFPYYLAGATIAAFVKFSGRYVGWEISALVVPLVFVIHNAYRNYLDRLESERNHAREMASLHLRTIEALAMAIEAKDDTTHEHLCRVQVYAGEIAKELGLGEEQMLAIQAASILHDIGKLAVPDFIISKPGKLTPEEFEKMKIHPVVGAEILERVQFPYPVVPIVRSHHEKWDGSGYPDGLKGEEIPIGSRILSVVDCLDALASDRQYRPAMPLEKALEIVVSESGRGFDPRIVEILQRRAFDLEKIAKSRSPAAPAPKLSKDIKVERGDAPAAGFEINNGKEPSKTSPEPGFVWKISAARLEAQRLYELSLDLGNSLSLAETMSLLCTRLKQIIPYDTVVIYLHQDDVLKPCFSTGENTRYFSGLSIPVGQGLSGWVADNAMPIINGNPAVEAGHLNGPSRFTTLRSALAIPLSGEHGLRGVLTLYALEKDAFSKDHLRILLAIQKKLSLTIENACRFQQAEESAATDGLTGLPNAKSLFLHLDKELSRCRRSDSQLGLVVCDLDGFKQVNDKHGHLAGNRVLKLLSERMREHCREYDCVARLGGDEFVIVLPNADHEKLKQKISQFAHVANQVGKEVCGEDLLSLSAGIASFPGDGQDADQLLAIADSRMYEAKQSSRRG